MITRTDRPIRDGGTMSTFTARLHLPGRAKLPLGVEVDIQQERMTLTSGDRTVAVLRLEDLDVISRLDGFHMNVDGEDVVLIVSESSRFAAALGIKEHRRMAVVKSKQPVGTGTDEEDLPDLERRIIETREALRSDAVTPAQACARWLSLLKEINRRHGQGSMPAGMYYRLNTELLDLIPGPALVTEELSVG
jgi:hypothetical protein